MNARFFYTLTVTLALTLAASTSSFAQTAKDQPTPAAQTQKLQTIKIKVSGITCSGDCKDIEKAVGKANGVTSSKLVSKPSATSAFEITFDPTVVSEKEIRKIVEATPGCENPNDRPYKVKQG